MLKANIERIIVKPVEQQALSQSNIIMPGQMKTGENLLVGIVEEPGETKFKKGQIVYYSEYSASAVVDLNGLFKGTMTFGEISKNTDIAYIVVAADDIMAYDDDLSLKLPEKKDDKKNAKITT